MSGISGIVYNEGELLTMDHITPMLQSLDKSGKGRSSKACFGSVGMGAQGFPGCLSGIAETKLNKQTLAMAFHGSLYNLKELFDLQKYDTNPLLGLLHLYLEEGMEFLHKFRGEFALAIWEGGAKTLYLATDRFRVHPLFYYQDPEKIVFSSKIQGIMDCPFPVKRTINPEAIVEVMANSFIPTPKTIFLEVKKLPAGNILTYHKGEIKTGPYWDISFLKPDGVGQTELTRKLKDHFAEAISVRLEEDNVSDNVGTFLSGGVDSSTIAGVLSRLTKRPVKSFSIGFDEKGYNELNYARIVARTFDTEHHEYLVTPQDVRNAIPVILDAFDEPFANASAIPTYFCAKLAREHGVKVLYAGDAGDELFAGNERYATQRLFDYYYKIPTWFREPLLKPMAFAMADLLKWDLLVKVKKYILRATTPYPERLSSHGVFELIPMRDLLEDSLLHAVGKGYDLQSPLYSYYSRAPADNELDRQLYIDLKLTISDNDLFKVTRMTEAAGVAVRFPFLDHRLAEYAMTIPANIKMKGRRLRSFFKKAYADLLPIEVRKKTKHGFGLPIAVWLRTDKQLNEMMHDHVLSPQSIQRGYFQKKTLEDLVARHKTDETSFYGTVLWNLMIIELWHRRYMG